MTLSIQPFRDCPRFKECSVNNCPLHPEYPLMFVDPADPEPRCTLAKTYREKVAEKFPGILKYGGLTTREFNGKTAWESLSQEEQDRRKEALKKYAFTSENCTEKKKAISKHGSLKNSTPKHTPSNGDTRGRR